MTRPSGIHHLAVMTKDIKAQLEFFTQVVGLPLVALYDMHGVPGAWHGFVRLDDTTYLAFAQVPGVESVESTLGVTHAGTGAAVSAPGTMQHVAFSVSDLDELLGLRDRLRSNDVVVLGPIDHGMCHSIYFAGPEGLTLEAACSAEAIDAAAWVDPAVVEKAGISPEELATMLDPPSYERPGEPVAQPAIRADRPHLAYPEEEYQLMVSLPDEVVARAASVPDPPVRPAG